MSPVVIGSTDVGPFTQRWAETGPAGSTRVLLLHGLYAGAHSFEWRNLVPVLDAEFLVRVPDLLGTGQSDRPDLEFTRDVVQRSVDALIEDAGADVAVVASSLTGAYALRSVAQGIPVRSLTLITPSGLGSPREVTPGRVNRAVYHLARHSPVGDAMVGALTSKPSVRWFQTNRTYRDEESLEPAELIETRRAGTLPNAKHLQLAFVFGRLAIDIDPADVATVGPIVIWATAQRFVDNAEAERWRTAGARVIEIDSGLPQVEDPDRVAGIIRAES